MTEMVGDDTDEASERQPPRPWTDLRDSGLLWLINRVVFHPRGWALFLVLEAGQIIGWRLRGDGAEVWRFDGPEDEHFARAQATLAGVAPSSRAAERAGGADVALLAQRYADLRARVLRSAPDRVFWEQVIAEIEAAELRNQGAEDNHA
jgi:hypothetical protein